MLSISTSLKFCRLSFGKELKDPNDPEEEILRNTMEKGENTGNQHFSLFPSVFSKGSLLRVVKILDCLVKVSAFENIVGKRENIDHPQRRNCWLPAFFFFFYFHSIFSHFKECLFGILCHVNGI